MMFHVKQFAQFDASRGTGCGGGDSGGYDEAF